MAEFYRNDGGYRVRFPDEGDFLISRQLDAIDVFPAPDAGDEVIERLLHTAIAPLLGNHQDGLFLHGSAVRIDDQAVAFLGLSRSGKTTLAASFASHGFPFLTEDVIDLDFDGDIHWLRPKRTAMRLFPDSARHILGDRATNLPTAAKADLHPESDIAFSGEPAVLRYVFVLGVDHDASTKLTPLRDGQALISLMPHAFLLDVEDKQRLRCHFDRLAAVAERAECFALDFQRDFSKLPEVREAILTEVRKGHRSQ
ncbi:hypothetical protein [Erythrobacter sp. MTPC3]|uniref:hypothetical protein n=1 Tax=Erythrobacter sp. MTPC3 TaxID=3056564 RepID=UPI0036F1E5D7